MARAKTKAQDLPVPQSREEAVRQAAYVGDLMRRVEQINLDLKTQIASLKTAAQQSADELTGEIDRQTEGLSTWASANRKSLTDDGRVKSVDLGPATIGWRLRPASVRVIGTEEEAIAALDAAGLDRFIRVRSELDKEAIRAMPGDLAGIPEIKVGSPGETFFVQPVQIETAEG